MKSTNLFSFRFFRNSVAAILVGLALPLISWAEDVNGTWAFDYGYEMTFSGSGGTFSGTGGTGSSYTWIISNGILAGNQISWSEDYNEIAYHVDRIGTIFGDTMSGTWTSSFGQNGDFTATRISGGGGLGGKRDTAIQLFCNRGGGFLKRATCTVTVGDAGPAPRTLPTGVVDFVASGGFYPGAASCFLQQTEYSPGVGSCEVEFAIPAGFGIGIPFPIDATFPGDSNFDPSSTSHQIITPACIGDQNNPCSGDVAMSFSNQVNIAKNKIKQIVLGCKNSTKAKQYLRIEPPQGTCLTDTQINMDLAKVLEKLTAEQIQLIGQGIKASEAKDDELLAKLKALSELTKEQIELFRTTEGKLRKVFEGSIDNIKNLEFSSVGWIRAAKKQPKRIVAFGAKAKDIRAGKQAILSISADKRMKKILSVFRRAAVVDRVLLEIKTTNRRQLANGKLGKSTKIVREVEAFLR